MKGLASREVARLIVGDRWGRAAVERLAQARGTRLAVIYESWFQYGELDLIPPAWIKVGEWTISHNVSVAADTVSFYAAGPGEEPRLISSLKQFASQLPPGVRQSGKYTEVALRP